MIWTIVRPHLLKLYYEGKDMADWYTGASEGKSYTFMKMVAATSPMCDVPTNIKLALRAWKQLNKLNNGLPDVHMKRPRYTGFIRSHKLNLRRATVGAALSGPKVKSFYSNLTGWSYDVTIDRWMLRAVRCTRDSLTVKQYDSLAAEFRALAEEVKALPCEFQAAVWTAMKRRNGDVVNERWVETYERIVKEIGDEKSG